MTAREITAALGGRWHNYYGSARCPAHEDREPSLSLRDGADGLPIFHCFAGCDWRAIKDALRARGFLPERAGEPAPLPSRHRKSATSKSRHDDGARAKMARQIWHEARPLAGTLAEIYLRERGLRPGPDGWPPSLRYHPGLKHGPTGLYLPCMIAEVTLWPGRDVSGVHRTFIRADGMGKAPVSGAKMMLGPCASGAVRLAQHGAELALSEGIETGFSIQQESGLPTWACLSTSGLCSVVLPPEVAAVIIAADNDTNGAGEEAAKKAAKRFLAEGRTAKIARPPKGMDFNDVLCLPAGVAVIQDHKRRAHHDR